MKLLIIFTLLILPVSATLNSAAVTKVINDVRVFAPKKAARTATVGERIGGRTSLQTGRRSRAELKFTDNTLTRIGANSIFSFRKGTRDIELQSGSLLLRVPKGSKKTRIRTATVTAGITGTTLMMEYSVGHWVKLIVLEGEVRLNINGGKQFQTIRSGEILVMDPNGKVVPQVMDVDLRKLRKSSKLLDRVIFGPLPAEAERLMDIAVATQRAELRKGILVRTNYRARGPAERAHGRRARGRIIRDIDGSDIPGSTGP